MNGETEAQQATGAGGPGVAEETADSGVTGRAAGMVLLLLGAAVGGEAMTFHVTFLTDPVGPKALPLLSALIFVGAGVALLVRPGTPVAWPTPPVLVRMTGAVAAFGVYAALLSPLGFVVATTATVAALSLLFGGPPRKSVAAAVTLSVVLWYLFVWVLGLTLPLGTLWRGLAATLGVELP